MVVDLFLVYQFIRRLAMPFEKWPAYEAGVIDKDGNILKGKRERNTRSEKESFGKFDLMLLKLKKLLAKVPGGSSRLGSYAAALWLIKEWNHFTDESLLNESVSEESIDRSLDLFLSRYNHYNTLSKDVNHLNESDAIILEKLKASDDMGDWIDDFYKSDAPQFKGKSKAKRRQMAIAAKLDAEEEQNEAATNMRTMKLINKIKKSGVVKSGSMSKNVDTKPEMKEEPTNSAGSGAVAGIGVGPQGEPGLTPAQMKKYKKKNQGPKRLRDIIGAK